jgi:hypothetical protein
MKYQLLKLLPFENSPRIGFTIEPDKSYDNRYHINYLIFDPKIHPEFWEPVVEKDYEILSVLIRRSDKHQQKIVDANDSVDYITSLINCDGNSIHSVKRLSDGEIFTIGDIIDTRVDNKYKQEILEISIKNNTIMFITKLGFVILSVAKKVKQPLFTTEQRSEIEKIIKNIIK